MIVRYYTIAEFNTGTCHQIADIAEIPESQFLELVADGGVIGYERFTTFWNGSNHVALTVTMSEFPDAEDLELV